jgi:hypothetical protein
MLGPFRARAQDVAAPRSAEEPVLVGAESLIGLELVKGSAGSGENSICEDASAGRALCYCGGPAHPPQNAG